MAKPIDVNKESFDREVLQVSGPVLVDFWSQTCPPCLALNPEYEKAADAQEGAVKCVKVASQEAMELFREQSVRATPTLKLFVNGAEVASESGYKTADQIGEWVKGALEQAAP